MSAAVGVYGGTFNPIHLGHLRAAEEVVEALQLERMLFVPSCQPPHKGGPHLAHASEDPIAPASERLAWTRLAVEGNPRFEVDACEVERSGLSFSVVTLRELSERLQPTKPVFTIGCDAFAELGSWREPGELLRLANFAITTRPPLKPASLRDWLPAGLRDEVEIAPDGRSARHLEAGSWLRVVEVSALDISSSDVRRRIRAGLSTRYLLPACVRRAVEASGCYRPASPANPEQTRNPGNPKNRQGEQA